MISKRSAVFAHENILYKGTKAIPDLMSRVDGHGTPFGIAIAGIAEYLNDNVANDLFCNTIFKGLVEKPDAGQLGAAESKFKMTMMHIAGLFTDQLDPKLYVKAITTPELAPIFQNRTTNGWTPYGIIIRKKGLAEFRSYLKKGGLSDVKIQEILDNEPKERKGRSFAVNADDRTENPVAESTMPNFSDKAWSLLYK